METWCKLRDLLVASGITPEATEAVRRLTAPDRHAARVASATRAAEEWVENRTAFRGTVLNHAAAAVAWLETRGLYGGGLKEPGAGTRRHPAFAECGKGRRQARDGLAWTAAIAAVCSGYSIEWSEQFGEIGVVVSDGNAESFLRVRDLVADTESLRTAACHAIRENWRAAVRGDSLARDILAAAASLLQSEADGE